jgi:asparaginyl-tRNA synthetase
MFGVTNFDLNQIPRDENGEIDFDQDFFGKKTNLTVSGQLEAETAAMGLGRVYTFGQLSVQKILILHVTLPSFGW